MLTVVETATEITFYPKDDNVGISRNMLSKIVKLCKAHGYDVQHGYGTFWPDDLDA